MPASNGGPAVVAAQPGAVQAQAAAATPTPAQLSSEVGRINAALKQANRNVELSISVDDATKKQVVTLKDKETGDTLLQYPSEAVLAIARSIDEFQQGQLLSRQA
jgi:flagellar protein FlaG